MKRILIMVVVAALLTAAAGIVGFRIQSPNAGRLDAPQLTRAIHAYAMGLEARGQTVPATVSLQELIQQSLIKASDVSVFEGLDVQFSLAADEKRPGDVLARVQLPDGQEFVALADGSVQQRRR